MSLPCYDQALLNYLRSCLSFDNIIKADESKVMETSIDKRSNESNHDVTVSLPMISFARTSISLPYGEGVGNMHARKSGKIVNKDYKNLTVDKYRSIPIVIQYQITIYSDNRREVDDIFRELLMYITTDNPILEVDFGYGKPDKFSMIVTDIDENTDVESFTDKGKLYTSNIILEIKEAQLVFLSTSKLTKEIPIRVTILHKSQEIL